MAFEYPTPVSFHAEGIKAELTGHPEGRCLLSLRHTEPGAAEEARLEIIAQGVDAHGLASGFASVVFQQRLVFSNVLGGEPTSFAWLPETLPFDVARNCYYRVVPCSGGQHVPAEIVE